MCLLMGFADGSACLGERIDESATCTMGTEVVRVRADGDVVGLEVVERHAASPYFSSQSVMSGCDQWKKRQSLLMQTCPDA
jgi:hypothetical protein